MSEHNFKGNSSGELGRSHISGGEVNEEEEGAFGNELGGARALLQLGNKNQPNDVDVEAAVMKLVGGIESQTGTNNGVSNTSLAGNLPPKKRKLQFTDEITNLNEFQQWTGFLEEELNASAALNSTHHHHHDTDNANQGANQGGNDETLSSVDENVVDNLPFLNSDGISGSSTALNTPKRQKKSRRREGGLQVDPELAQLDSGMPSTAAEHEQLVHAAIMNARDLENEFGPINVQEVNDYFKEGQQKLDLDRQMQEQAAQVVVDQQHHEDVLKKNKKKQPKKSKSKPAREWEKRITPLPSAQDESKLKLDPMAQPAIVGKTFSKDEVDSIDNFVLAFCQVHNMTREQMCQRIWSNRRQKDHFWESLQKVLPYRTRASLYKHVRRSYHIFQVRGKWTVEEDQELGKLALENPGNWKVIGKIMGRMPEDCRDRYRNYVKCGNNRSSSKWSDEEENMLKDIVNSMIQSFDKNRDSTMINWTVVSEQMNGKRSRIQCRYKWNKLVKNAEKRPGDEDPIDDDKKAIAPLEKERQLWLLGQLKNIYTKESEIEWDIMFTIYPYSTKENPQDFEFEVLNGDNMKDYYEMIKMKYGHEDMTDDFVDKIDYLIKKIDS